MKTALYPLDSHPTTFDFVTWSVIAKTMGFEHVRFVVDRGMDERKYEQEYGWKRFANILIPACRLAGMSYSVGKDNGAPTLPYLYGHVERLYRKSGRIAKLALFAVIPESGYITVTLRESFRNMYRNSNRKAWERFISEQRQRGQRVVVLEECEQSPLCLYRRMDLYAGADMNLGVANGPMALCHFSDAPYLTFNIIPKRPEGEPGYDLETLLRSSGFPIGGQFSFAGPRQRLIWEPDTYEVIMREYEAMQMAEAA